MLAVTRALNRWLNKSYAPTPEAIRYYWWVLGTGEGEMAKVLGSYGFSIEHFWVLDIQRDYAERTLDIWDTERFLEWRRTGKIPHIPRPFNVAAVADPIESDDITLELNLPTEQLATLGVPHVFF